MMVMGYQSLKLRHGKRFRVKIEQVMRKNVLREPGRKARYPNHIFRFLFLSFISPISFGFLSSKFTCYDKHDAWRQADYVLLIRLTLQFLTTLYSNETRVCWIMRTRKLFEMNLGKIKKILFVSLHNLFFH